MQSMHVLLSVLKYCTPRKQFFLYIKKFLKIKYCNLNVFIDFFKLSYNFQNVFQFIFKMFYNE